VISTDNTWNLQSNREEEKPIVPGSSVGRQRLTALSPPAKFFIEKIKESKIMKLPLKMKPSGRLLSFFVIIGNKQDAKIIFSSS
jgi:hypothetical protein